MDHDVGDSSELHNDYFDKLHFGVWQCCTSYCDCSHCVLLLAVCVHRLFGRCAVILTDHG